MHFETQCRPTFYTVPVPLTSYTSASHLQDRSARQEVCPWCCSCVSAGTQLRVSRSKTSEGAHGYGLRLLDVVEDVNRTAKFCGPLWAINLEQFAINSAIDGSLSPRAFKGRR